MGVGIKDEPAFWYLDLSCRGQQALKLTKHVEMQVWVGFSQNSGTQPGKLISFCFPSRTCQREGSVNSSMASKPSHDHSGVSEWYLAPKYARNCPRALALLLSPRTGKRRGRWALGKSHGFGPQGTQLNTSHPLNTT